MAISGLFLDAAEPPAASAESAAEHAVIVATRLAEAYFAEHYTMPETETQASVHLGTPSAVEGWPGHWRMRGAADVRFYRTDANWARRELEIRSNPNLSVKEINRLIERERLKKLRVYDIEVVVMNLDSKPQIDVTIKMER